MTNDQLNRRLIILDSRVQFLANDLVPLVIAKGKREKFARALGVDLCQVQKADR